MTVSTLPVIILAALWVAVSAGCGGKQDSGAWDTAATDDGVLGATAGDTGDPRWTGQAGTSGDGTPVGRSSVGGSGSPLSNGGQSSHGFGLSGGSALGGTGGKVLTPPGGTQSGGSSAGGAASGGAGLAGGFGASGGTMTSLGGSIGMGGHDGGAAGVVNPGGVGGADRTDLGPSAGASGLGEANAGAFGGGAAPVDASGGTFSGGGAPGAEEGVGGFGEGGAAIDASGGETSSGGSAAVGEGGAGAASSAGAAGSDPLQAQPCGDTPLEGRCASSTQLWTCAVPSGDAEPTLVIEDCAPNEECVEISSGASCEALPGTCSVAGASECSDERTLRRCNGFEWDTVDCGGPCRETALGAFCPPAVETAPYAGALQYEARAPNAAYTNWDTSLMELPARGMLVVSFRGEEFIDATLTDAAGAFTLEVPSPPQVGDRVHALLLRPNALGTAYRFGVGLPYLGTGTRSIYMASSTASGIWQWSLDPVETPSGGTHLITEALGSGAVHVFDVMGRAHDSTDSEYGTPGRSLIVWLRMNMDWQECGACFVALPALAGNLFFQSQIFLPATAQDQAFWSEAVVAHELGHWVMWSYGVSPREGGAHCIGVPTYPGQAWSEGWATGFSSLVRQDAIYYDKQSGTMFWIDISSRQSVFGAWTRPAPEDGLLQLMDENEVASMVWSLASDRAIGTSAVFDALASSRMKVGPFDRGYTRHTWTMDGCTRTSITNTGESAPMVADFLDALVCGGAPGRAVDATTEPASFYPYPSQEPLCRAM